MPAPASQILFIKTPAKEMPWLFVRPKPFHAELVLSD